MKFVDLWWYSTRPNHNDLFYSISFSAGPGGKRQIIMNFKSWLGHLWFPLGFIFSSFPSALPFFSFLFPGSLLFDPRWSKGRENSWSPPPFWPATKLINVTRTRRRLIYHVRRIVNSPFNHYRCLFTRRISLPIGKKTLFLSFLTIYPC